MNAIFLKEVPDTVLDEKLVSLKQVKISSEDYIIELSISYKVSQSIIKNLLNSKTSVIKNFDKFAWINNVKTKFILNRFKKKLARLIYKNELSGFAVIYANEIKKKSQLKEYLNDLLEKYSILEYINVSTVEKNIDKYIAEYVEKNDLRQENISVLIALNNIENLNINLLESLNEKYKVVNIFSSLKPTKKSLSKIKKINDEYGSCVSVLSKTEKDFRKYDICVFVDKSRAEYTKYKFNKKACFIDFTNKENDKFNEKYLKLENGIKNNIYYEDKVKELYNLYGKITVANAIM